VLKILLTFVKTKVMHIKDFLKIVNVDKSDTSYFYKNITDEKPVEIEIINSYKNGDCEIIRLSQINGRTKYAGFFHNNKYNLD